MNFQLPDKFSYFPRTQNNSYVALFDFFLRNSRIKRIIVSLRTTITKRKRPQDRKRKRAFIRTHLPRMATGKRQQFSWNRRSGRSWRKREREGNVETKRKVEEREHFLYEEARLFTGAGTKWKMLDSTRSSTNSPRLVGKRSLRWSRKSLLCLRQVNQPRVGALRVFLASSVSTRGNERIPSLLGALSFIFDSFVSFASLHHDKADKGNLFREGGGNGVIAARCSFLLLLLLFSFRLRNC